MKEEYFKQVRKSNTKVGEKYFFTATINKWQTLLLEEKYKQIVISSLKYLSNAGLIDVLAFVIMPNHLHLIWRIKGENGGESVQGSFVKYTAHEFKKILKNEPNRLEQYKVNASNKKYEFWQRDPLSIPLYSKDVIIQKLNYIHNNPLAKHWQLAVEPSGYKYSSARYYELGIKDFDFIKDIRDDL